MSLMQSDGGQDFDLNLAPIIDCFTVLIAYMLVSASFISLMVLDVGVAVVGQTTTQVPAGTPPYSLIVELGYSHSLTLKLAGGPQSLNLTIPLASDKRTGAWDTQELRKRIVQLMSQYTTLKEVTLTAAPAVIYKDVVYIVEELKKYTDKVFLSG